MKTIGYTDRAYPNFIRTFSMTDDTYLLPDSEKSKLTDRITKHRRIMEAFADMKGTALINIYYVKGKKFRLIAKRGY